MNYILKKIKIEKDEEDKEIKIEDKFKLINRTIDGVFWEFSINDYAFQIVNIENQIKAIENARNDKTEIETLENEKQGYIEKNQELIKQFKLKIDLEKLVDSFRVKEVIEETIPVK